MFIGHPTLKDFVVGRANHQSKVFTFDHSIDDDNNPYVPLTPSSGVRSNSVPLNWFLDLLMILLSPATSNLIVHIDSKTSKQLKIFGFSNLWF